MDFEVPEADRFGDTPASCETPAVKAPDRSTRGRAGLRTLCAAAGSGPVRRRSTAGYELHRHG